MKVAEAFSLFPTLCQLIQGCTDREKTPCFISDLPHSTGLVCGAELSCPWPKRRSVNHPPLSHRREERSSTSADLLLHLPACLPAAKPPLPASGPDSQPLQTPDKFRPPSNYSPCHPCTPTGVNHSQELTLFPTSNSTSTLPQEPSSRLCCPAVPSAPVVNNRPNTDHKQDEPKSLGNENFAA